MLFISFAIMLLVVTNSVFDSTEKGVQETFVTSFTGDIVIRPKSVVPLSLFGDETPMTGSLTDLPVIVPYSEINAELQNSGYFSNVVPQITGYAALYSTVDYYKPTYIFGIEGQKYVDCMSSIKILEGEVWKDGYKGLMLSKKNAEKKNLKVGDKAFLIFLEGLGGRAREVPVTAIYDYKTENQILDNIVLINAETVRSLLDMSDLTDASAIQLSEEKESILDEGDIDDLFSDASDSVESVKTEEIKYSKEDHENLMSSYSSSTWNFIICKLNEPKKVNKVIKNLNKTFQEKGWEVEAVNWRSAAGNTAFYLYMLRLILNVGIIIVLGAGFIVVNNTLVINVLDRIREIGTMRAIGANKRYISLECMSETLIMALVSGVFGCILGIIASNIVNIAHISFSNNFLVQLFGSGNLVTEVTFNNLCGSFTVAVVIGLIAWIYPVYNALKVNPVQAMQGAK